MNDVTSPTPGLMTKVEWTLTPTPEQEALIASGRIQDPKPPTHDAVDGLSANIRSKVDRLNRWLSADGRLIPDPNDIVAGFIERLEDLGVPIDRFMSALPTSTAVRRGVGRRWVRGEGVTEISFGWGREEMFHKSPFFLAYWTQDWLLIRPEKLEDDAFNVMPDLKAAGITHYLCFGVNFANGDRAGIAIGTKAPGGFTTEHLTILRAIEPALGAMMEIAFLRRSLDEILKTYVGTEPQQMILSGDVRRGQVRRIGSAILFSDMRNSTALSADKSAEDVADLFNRYYDCVVPAVENAGGEVLKFIGDGILAIFRTGTDRPRQACGCAYDAAIAALAAVDDIRNEGSVPDRFDIGLGLHVGRVAYGNVGSGARLDYTVIGGDVNLTSRIESLCKPTGERLLMSKAFAETVGAKTRSVGIHALEGIEPPQEVFAPERQ